jgi:hypothetical protein
MGVRLVVVNTRDYFITSLIRCLQHYCDCHSFITMHASMAACCMHSCSSKARLRGSLAQQRRSAAAPQFIHSKQFSPSFRAPCFARRPP